MVNSIKIIKEFFLDIIGYYIPGVIACVIASIVFPHLFENFLELNKNLELSILGIVVPYSIGYIIYGIGIAFDFIYGDRCPKKSILNEIKESNSFKEAKKKLNSEVSIENEVRPVRNKVMSYMKKDDLNKIFTFMFRSDLAHHLSVVCFISSITGIIRILCNGNEIYQSPNMWIFFVFLLISSIVLYFVRIRFYSIAMRIPFSYQEK